MVHLHRARERVALGQRRNEDLGNRKRRVVALFGFIPPDDDCPVVLVGFRSHDLRNDLREEIVPLRNG